MSKSVHDFIANLTTENTAALTIKRSSPVSFINEIKSSALDVAGFIDSGEPQTFFLGSEFDSYAQVSTKEKWLVRGEGQCMSSAVVYTPTNGTAPYQVVILYMRKDKDQIGALPGKIILGLAQLGYMVVVPDLCGFGESGDTFPSGSDDQPCPDMAHELGRSIPGIHAGDIVRMAKYIQGRSDVASIHATLSWNQTHPALFLAGIALPKSMIGRLLVYEPLATWESCAVMDSQLCLFLIVIRRTNTTAAHITTPGCLVL